MPDTEPKDAQKPEEPLVTVFEGGGVSAEMEAQSIHALLESSGISSVVVRENVPALPVGSVEVRVIASESQRAKDVIRAGRLAGPAAAEAAEAETEL